LTKWFLTILLMTWSGNDIAALELMRQLGVKHETAWPMKQKLMKAMLISACAETPASPGTTQCYATTALAAGTNVVSDGRANVTAIADAPIFSAGSRDRPSSPCALRQYLLPSRASGGIG